MKNKSCIEFWEDFSNNSRVYKIVIARADYLLAEFSEFDLALLNDVDSGEPSSTPIADKLLALEMVARRIEEAYAKKRLSQQSKTSPKVKKGVR